MRGVVRDFLRPSDLNIRRCMDAEHVKKDTILRSKMFLVLPAKLSGEYSSGRCQKSL